MNIYIILISTFLLPNYNIKNMILNKPNKNYNMLINNNNNSLFERKINESFNNIKSINHYKKEDLWLIDLKINNNLENNITFPSFNEFINNNNKNFDKLIKDTQEIEDKLISNIDGLKLIKSNKVIDLTKEWIYDMINSKHKYEKFIYEDLFLMRDYALVNNTKKHFYISYFPPQVRSIHGSHYIAAVELCVKKREFKIQLFIQNPNYMIQSEYDEKKIVDFKYQLIALCKKSGVFFEYSDLKKNYNSRYYYSWLYS